jgi:long-chain acyl-CoA synthetase
MSDYLIFQISLRFIEYFIRVYDSIASLINFLFQKSRNPLNQSQDKLPKQTETFTNNNSWTRNKSIQNQIIDESLNVSEIFSKAVQLYKDKRCLGIRQIIGEESEKQSDGKIYHKLSLGDYQWFTYQQIDERVDNIIKGLLWSGVKPGDNVMIFGETRLEWMLSFQALLRIGNTVSIVYTYLGENEIVHCINETEVTHIITNFDLSKLLRLEKRILLVKCIILMDGHKSGNSFETKNSALKLLSFSQIEREGKSYQSLKGENNKPNDIAGKAFRIIV